MKKIITTLFCLYLFLAVTAQEQDKQNINTNSISLSKEKYWKELVQELYEPGISKNKDSMHISAEAKKVMQDSNYRTLIFPNSYTWPSTQAFLNQMELKKAFWFLIKLYVQDTLNRELVIKTILPFDKTFETDKVLISTFYTYALLDPAVCTFKNNKIKITRPDILENEFNKVKEMIAYVTSYRAANTNTKGINK